LQESSSPASDWRTRGARGARGARGVPPNWTSTNGR
jgi:hypothetical protein